MKQILFIHRSVGENLVVDGNIYSLIDKKTFNFSDLNQNNGRLRNNFGIKKTNLTNCLENTTPKDLAVLFSQKTSQLKDYALTHDIIVIKSCYPNSNIKSEMELAQVKQNYRHIFQFFTNVSAKLVILTSPPLRFNKTNIENAKRARELSEWLIKNQSDSVYVFNLFDLLAETEQKRANTLKRSYQRFWFFDSHPNKIANQQIAPKFIRFLSDLDKTNK